MKLFTLMWKRVFLLFLMVNMAFAWCKRGCRNKGYRSATNKFCEQIQVDNCLVRKSILFVESMSSPKEIFNNSYAQINKNYENLCPGYFRYESRSATFLGTSVGSSYEFTPDCIKIEPIVISSSSKLVSFVYFFYYFVFTNLI
jgi:hypothetical protein